MESERISEVISNNRSEKGKSLVIFPDSFTIVDLETTGLSPKNDVIIEISAIKIRNSEIVDSFSSLAGVNGYVYIDEYITELTGITQEMVDNAPKISEVFPKFIEFVSDDIIVGHNVNFDINFIYDTSKSLLNKSFCNSFVDTMRIAKKLYPDWKHFRLRDLASHFNIDYSDAHRSLADCKITFECYNRMKFTAEQTYGSVDSFLKSTVKHTRHSKESITHSIKIELDPDGPFYGKVCVFTGVLEKMQRCEAMQIISSLGGLNGNGVTKKTNYLILGNNDYCKSIKGGKSSKQKKAEELKLRGYDIEILPESVFYEMIGINNSQEDNL